MMRRGMITAAAVIGSLVLCMGSTVVAKEAKEAKGKEVLPDATIEMSGKSVDAGVGYTWGSGTLTFKGKRYPISIEGFSVGSVGVDTATASGKVYHLKKIEDFNGNYAALGAGATVGGGAGIATMKNQNGVVIDMESTARGLKVAAGASGIKMKIKS